VPCYDGMQRVTTLQLAERGQEDARVLVLGDGGGLELKAFAQAHPDLRRRRPASEMLKLAERILGPLASRATLHQGYIDDAPMGPFDAATCLLTLQFLALEERRRTAAEVTAASRLAPFVVAHLSVPQGEGKRALWLASPPIRRRTPARRLTRS
jgi:tRNA (cmo5U34)-methyltransferase